MVTDSSPDVFIRDPAIGSDVRISAPLCAKLPECQEGQELRCGQYAVFVPQRTGLPRRVCFYHLQQEAGEDGIRVWLAAILDIAGRDHRLSELNLGGAEFKGSARDPVVFADGTEFSDVHLERAAFKHVCLQHAKFCNGTRLSDALFENCNLSSAVFYVHAVRGLRFSSCDLSHSSWLGVRNTHQECKDPQLLVQDWTLKSVKLDASILRNVVMYGVRFDDVRFHGAEISGLSVHGGHWSNVDLSRANLRMDQLNINGGLVLENGCRIPERFEGQIEELAGRGDIIKKGVDAVRYVGERPITRIEAPSVTQEIETFLQEVGSPTGVSGTTETGAMFPLVGEAIVSAGTLSLLVLMVFVLLNLPGQDCAGWISFAVALVGFLCAQVFGSGRE